MGKKRRKTNVEAATAEVVEKPKKERSVTEPYLQPRSDADMKRDGILGGIIVGIVVLLIAAGIGFGVWNSYTAKKKNTEQQQSSYEVMNSADTAKPSDYVTKDGAIQFAPSGVVKGSLPSEYEKLPKVDVYLDPICPGCGAVDRALNQYYADYLSKGTIVLRIHPISIRDISSTDKYSTRASSAILRSLDVDPDLTYQYITYLMSSDIQPKEATAYKPVTDKMLQQYAVKVGMDKNKVKILTDGKYTKWMEKATDYTTTRTELWRDGASSFATPVVTVDGKQMTFDDTSALVSQFQNMVSSAYKTDTGKDISSLSSSTGSSNKEASKDSSAQTSKSK